ncbi:MAG: FmdB family zinc ribbon protein, partial [Planctomycetota bacterium]
MSAPRCPGQDMRYWGPDAIYDIDCPWCDTEIEFWKDEPERICPGCGKAVRNPKIDLGCAKWCKFAKECVGTLGDNPEQASPLLERLLILQERCLADDPDQLERVRLVLAAADRILEGESQPDLQPLIVKAAALIAGGHCDEAFRLQPHTCAHREANRESHGILARAGLDEEATAQVWKALASLNPETSPQSPEEHILHDTLKLVRLEQTG